MIERVTGFAATRPLPDENPAAESNQRITLSLAVSKSNAAAKAKTPIPAAPLKEAPPPAAPQKLSDAAVGRPEKIPTAQAHAAGIH
jgi:chemotaxis protein MotB